MAVPRQKFWIVTSLNRVPDCHKCLGGQTYYFALKARKDITYLLSTHNESTTFNWGRVKNKTLRCVCSWSCSSYSCFSDIRLISAQRTCSVRGAHLMLFRNYLLWYRDVPSLCFERYLAWNRSCPIGRRYSRGSECHCLVHYAFTILQIRMSTPHHSYFLKGWFFDSRSAFRFILGPMKAGRRFPLYVLTTSNINPHRRGGNICIIPRIVSTRRSRCWRPTFDGWYLDWQ